MLAKIQESYYFVLVVMDVIGIALSQTIQRLCELVDTRTSKNKLYAILLIGCTIPIVLLESDATATIFVGVIAIPMFFAKKSWID